MTALLSKEEFIAKKRDELKNFLTSLNPGTFEDALKLEQKLMNFFVEVKKIDNFTI